MEISVLFAIKQIQQSCGDAHVTCEVTDTSGVHIESTQSAESCLQVANARVTPLEANSAASEATETEKYLVFHIGGDGCENHE